MQHMRFKAEQTAAHYVADGLDNETQQAFELHMMDCDECVSDVEVWRALKANLPDAANEHTTEPALRSLPDQPAVSAPVISLKSAGERRPARHAGPAWRMAAGLAGVGLVGVLAGWFAREAQGPGRALAAGEALVYNLPPVTRGISCAPLPLNAHASIVLLRIPDATPGATILARTADGASLAKEDYATRIQDDGSWVLQFRSAALRNRAVSLVIESPGQSPQSLGCVTGLGPG